MQSVFALRYHSGLEANCSYELGTPQLVFPLHPAIEPRQRAHTNMGGTGSADQVREKFYFLYIYSGMSLFYFVSPFFSSSVVVEADFLEAVLCRWYVGAAICRTMGKIGQFCPKIVELLTGTTGGNGT